MDIQSINDYGKEVNLTVAENLKFLLRQMNMTQSELSNALEKKGIRVVQSMISKYVDKTSIMPLAIAKAICDVLSVSLIDFVYEDMNKNVNSDAVSPHQTKSRMSSHFKHAMDMIFENNKDFVYDTVKDSKEFEYLKGDYYCYFHPTISDEKNNILTGSINFRLDNKVCEVTLNINTDKFDEKEQNKKQFIKRYTGVMLLSKRVDCYYCILRGKEVEELVFLSFRRLKLNMRLLDCRIAAVLTTSAGENNYPVVLRMLISKDEIIGEEHHKAISPLLKLNTSEIYVKEEQIEQLKEVDSYKKILGIFDWQSLPSQRFVEVDESLVSALANKLLDHDEALKLISSLRAESLAHPHNKVSKKADDNMYKLLRDLGYFNRSTKANDHQKSDMELQDLP